MSEPIGRSKSFPPNRKGPTQERKKNCKKHKCSKWKGGKCKCGRS